MYLDHFSLKETPFDMQPDIKFYCPCDTHKQAEQLIEYTIGNNDSITKITGPIGTGKTLLIDRIKRILPQKHTITILNPNCEIDHLVNKMLMQLPTDKGEHTHDLLAQLEKTLYFYAQELKPVVLIIDEAQTIDPKTLEVLRLYTNLRMNNQPILQLILVGQPELNNLLQQPPMEQIAQRINFSHTIQPLSLDEVRHYLHQRISRSGPNKRIFWEKDSINLIFDASKGLPRHVNKVAHKALMLAYFDNSHVVTKKHVYSAAKDSELTCTKPGISTLSIMATINTLLFAVTTYIVFMG